MAPLDFPSSPVDGEVFGSYIWSASKGVWQSREESAAPAVVSSVPPTTANPGDIWVDSSDGVAYVRYDDGTSPQWIEMISSGVPSLASKANLDGGNTFTGTQTFNTPISIASGGTGNNTGVNLIPTGAMMMWYTNTAPSGWLLCNGQSTTGYPALAAIVGSTVPNLQGRVPVGRDAAQTEFDTLGESGGAKTHTLSVNEMPAHSHGLGGRNVIASGGGTPANSPTNGSSWVVTPFNTDGGGQAHNNLQPYIVLNYIIKT